MNLAKNLIASRYQEFCLTNKYEKRTLHNFMVFLLSVEVTPKDLKRITGELQVVEIVIDQLQTFSELNEFKKYFYPLILSSGNVNAKNTYLGKLRESIIVEIKEKNFIDLIDCITIYNDVRLFFEKKLRQKLDKMIREKINDVKVDQVQVYRDDLTYVKYKYLYEQLKPTGSIFIPLIERKLITFTNYKLKAIKDLDILILIAKAIPANLEHKFNLIAVKAVRLFAENVVQGKNPQHLCDLYKEIRVYLSTKEQVMVINLIAQKISTMDDLRLFYTEFIVNYSRNIDFVRTIIKNKSLEIVKAYVFKNFQFSYLLDIYSLFSEEAKQLLVEKIMKKNSENFYVLVFLYELASEYRSQIGQKVFLRFLFELISVDDFQSMGKLTGWFKKLVDLKHGAFMEYRLQFLTKWLVTCVTPEQVISVKSYAKHLVCSTNDLEHFYRDCDNKVVNMLEDINSHQSLRDLYQFLNNNDERSLKDKVLEKIIVISIQ